MVYLVHPKALAAIICLSILSCTGETLTRRSNEYGIYCAKNFDCNLNGACNTTNGRCRCVSGWTGPSCSVLNLAPALMHNGFAMENATTASWGGSVVLYNGTYHMYVNVIANNCPLCTFATNSHIVHATSITPDGPYTYRDVALPAFSANPQVVLYKDEGVGRTKFALFHTGNADAADATVCNACVDGQPPTTCACRLPSTNAAATQAGASSAGTVVHLSTSPSGPWRAVAGPRLCNNPAPMRHRNGSWFLLCNNQLRRDARGIYYPIYHTEHLAQPMWRLTSSIRLPYPANTPRDTSPRVYEDPFMFQQRDGSWHVIWHVFNGTRPCGECEDDVISGHHFSLNGIDWQEATQQPFGHTIAFENGGSVVVSTRERPTFVRGRDGAFSHIVSAVCKRRSCAPTRSVNCKYNCNDFTLVQPLL